MLDQNNGAKLNVALIGCGRIAQTHLQALSAVPECNLIGVSDIRKKAAQSVADQFRCKAFNDYRNILDENNLDAVIVCTPPNTHMELVTFFLEKGIHLLCEKPLAVNVEQATKMVNIATENGIVLMMASKFRYVDDIVKAKGIIESGILGEIVLFENVFCSKVDMKDRWNSKKQIAGGGVLIDNGSHSVDIARYLLGPITKVQAEQGKRVQNLEIEDTVRLFFKTESGIMGDIDLSWSIYKEKESYIDIFGTEGVLSIGWKCSKYRQSETLDWITFGRGFDKISAFSRQIKNFADAINGRDLPLITAKDSLESVKVIEAAYKSISTDKWIEV